MASFPIPFVLCFLAILVAGVLVRVQAREALLGGQVRRAALLLAGVILGSGLWGAQAVVFATRGLHVTLLSGALHWAVHAALATGFLLWYRHHAGDGAARVTGALLLTVTAMQLSGLSGHVSRLSLTHGLAAATLLVLGAVSAWSATRLVRRPGLPPGAQLLAVATGQSAMVTLFTLAAAALLVGAPGAQATLPVALGTAGALLLTVLAGVVGDAQQRRVRRFEQLVTQRTTELAQERDFHVALLDSLNDQVVICDAQGQLVQHNEAAARLHARTLRGTLAPDWAATYGLHTPDFARLLRREEIPLYRALQGQPVRGELIGIEAGGTQRIVACNATPIRAAQGGLAGAVVAMTDVTERERARQELSRTAVQHAEIIESLDEALLLLHPDGQILSRNGRVQELLGPQAGQAGTLEDLLRPLVVRDAQGQVMAGTSPNFRALLGGAAHFTQSVVQIERPDGQRRWLHSRAQATFQGGEMSGVLYLFRDVTHQQELHEQLARVTRFAPVTALPNRAHFETLAAALPVTAQQTVLLAQCLSVTDLRALPGGQADELTLAFVRALRVAYPEALLTGQLDERTFALVLPSRPAHLPGALVAPVPVQGETVFPRVRACARQWAPHEAVQRAVHEAESSLPLAAEGTLLPFEERHLDDRRRRLHLEGALRRALQRESFTVQYQPIIHLGTGQVVKAEALVRWHDEELGAVSPAQFIPLAEQMGQIQVITAFVTRAALLEARRASAALGRDVRVAVNLSPSELNAADFMPRMQRLVAQEPDAARFLVFEVTESGALLNLEQVTRHLTTLREWGFGLALDDFGTGHSALSVLQHLPIQHLKLDRTFVWGIEGNERLQVLTGAVMELASRLHFEVVAEGIETLSHEAILREMGCTLGQGYLYSRPQTNPDWAALDGWSTAPSLGTP